MKKTERRRIRLGCSCWGLLFYGIFGLLCLGVIAFLGIREYLSHKALAALSPAEKAEFTAWLNETHEVTEEWINSYQPIPDDIFRDKMALYNDLGSIRISSGIDIASMPYTSICRDLIGGASIDPDLLAEALTSSSVVLPLFDRLDELASRDGYAFSSNHPFTSIEPWTIMQPFLARIYIETANDEIATAISHLDILLRAQKDVPVVPDYYMDMRRGLLSHTSSLTAIFASRTSDSATIELLTRLYESNRSVFLIDPRNTGMISDSLLVMQVMKHDGYPHTPPPAIYTNRQLLSHTFNVLDYLLWLHPKLPASDPRKAGFDEIFELPKPPALTPSNLTLDNLKAHAIRFFGNKAHYLSKFLLSEVDHQLSFWKDVERERVRNLSIHTQYHLTRLFLARRMAELRGDPLPVT